MGYLVFVGGGIGINLLEHLFKLNEPVDRIVLTRPTAEIKQLAAEHDVDLLPYYADKAVLDHLNGRYSWLLNLWSSTRIPERILRLAGHRLNVHPGLVPMTRGSDCATWAIRHHHPAGATLMEMEASYDTGAVYSEMKVDFSFPTSGGELHRRVKDACLALFERDWAAIRDAAISPVPQGQGARTYTRAETLSDRSRNLDVDDKTREVIEWALAHSFPQDTHPILLINGYEYRLDIALRRCDLATKERSTRA